MPNVPYPYEVNSKLVTGNGSLTPICSLSNQVWLYISIFSYALEKKNIENLECKEGLDENWNSERIP